MSRTSVVLTGLLGLVGAIMVTAFCILVMAQGWIPVILTSPLIGWGLFLFLAVFSVAEIPVMIFGMRRMAASAQARAKTVVLITNVGFAFFGAVYAAPFILLTGNLAAGAALAALSLVRFISAIIFLPAGKTNESLEGI